MGLRYFIIPLLVLAYLWWSYRSIRDIISSRDKAGFNLTDSTGAYIFHLGLIVCILLYHGALEVFELVIKYW